MTLFIFSVILAYLMGSICSAIIVCRSFSLPDPRLEGSKNPGATNVLRIAGKEFAALVMIVDVLKGTIPVVIAKALGADPLTLAFTCLAAVIGHMYPIFFDFKGGKGVATAIGALFGFHFIFGFMVAATWVLVAKFTRYSSLASIIAIFLAPFYSLNITNEWVIFWPLFVMALLVLYKHKDNIIRLINGNETKINLKQKVSEEFIEVDQIPIHQEKESEKKENNLDHTKEVQVRSLSEAKATKTVAKPQTKTKTKTKKTADTEKPTKKKITKPKSKKVSKE